MKKRIIFIILLSLIILSLVISNIFAGDKRVLRVAACPTYHGSISQLDPKKYELFFSESTAQSINLLENDLVDIIVSGRTLKPNENIAYSLVLGKGYSFLSNSEHLLFINELKEYNVYTDLEIQEIKNIFPVINISRVENVYDYINEGLIITSWEETDYNNAEVVHLLENNGQRVKLSRQATAHYTDQSINLEDLKVLTF